MNLQERVIEAMVGEPQLYLESWMIADLTGIEPPVCERTLRDLHSSGMVMLVPGHAGNWRMDNQWTLPRVYYEPHDIRTHRRWAGNWEPPMWVRRAQAHARAKMESSR
jgi:hypothetical protein